MIPENDAKVGKNEPRRKSMDRLHYLILNIS
jgi:hypothetical protein